MNEPKPALSEDQRAFLRPAITKISEGFAELHDKLDELGWEDGDFGCTRCDCAGFQSQSRPTLICARSTCEHRFTLHRVF